MQGRQVALVFVVLVAIAIAGLVGRFFTAGSDELSFEGLLPITPDVVDEVTLEGGSEQTTIRRQNNEWLLVTGRTEPAFDRRLAVFWNTVLLVDGAQLIARNPDNHERMGVDESQGVRVGFYLGDALQEELIFSTVWSEEARLCYVRRPRGDDVYGVPCGFSQIFDPSPYSWRDPIIAQLPREELDSLTFTYPDDAFVLRRAGPGWVVEAEGQQFTANPLQVETMLQLVEFIVAQGFVEDDQSGTVDFGSPHAQLTVATAPGSQLGGVNMLFLRVSDDVYYVKRQGSDDVYLLDGRTVDALLRPREGYIFTIGEGEGGQFTPESLVQSKHISEAAWGDEWPLTVPEVTLYCRARPDLPLPTSGATEVSIEVDGQRYAVNGTARTHTPYPDFDPLWKPHPDPESAAQGLRVDASRLINEGLAMCGN